MEREQRDLLVRLLRNLGSPKAPIRRAAASSALAWAQGCGLLPFLIDATLRMATQQSRFFTPSKRPGEGLVSPQRQWIPTDPDCEVGALVGLAHIFRTAGSASFDSPRPLTPMLQLAFSAYGVSLLHCQLIPVTDCAAVITMPRALGWTSSRICSLLLSPS